MRRLGRSNAFPQKLHGNMFFSRRLTMPTFADDDAVVDVVDVVGLEDVENDIAVDKLL